MAETELTAAQATALDGTTDSDCDFVYHSPADAAYYTAGQRQRQRLLTLAKALGNKFRVYKDGAATYGIRPGKVRSGTSTLSYTGSTGNSLTTGQTNYVWLYVSGSALTVGTSTTDFPNPSTTPHLPLATIVMGATSYDYDDITDCRQLCCFRLNSNMTAADENTLTGGSNADALHTHDSAGIEAGAIQASELDTDAVETLKIKDANVTVAKLSAALQDMIPNIVITGTDDEDGTGYATLDIEDAAGNALSQRFLVRVWVADAEFSEPDAQTGFTVDTGELMKAIEANADLEVISDEFGQIIMDINTGGAKTVYVMAELDGRVYSGTVTITA